MKHKRYPVMFFPNRQGHLLDEEGNGICGSYTGDWDADDVFVVDGICYEIHNGRCILKEDYNSVCRKCLHKLGFKRKLQDIKIQEMGNIYPKFVPFVVLDFNYVQDEIQNQETQ